MLEAFIRLLIDNGLVARELPADEDRAVDEADEVIHHAVIAGRLGLDHGYEIDRYMCGPYSTRLGDDYDDAAARARAGLEAGSPAPPLPAGFAADRFVRLVSGKDPYWLYMAARMIDASPHRRHAEGLVEWFDRDKGVCPEEYCRVILREMTSPEIGIALDYGTEASKEEWDALVAEFGSEQIGAEAWTAEELAARSPPAAGPPGRARGAGASRGRRPGPALQAAAASPPRAGAAPGTLRTGTTRRMQTAAPGGTVISPPSAPRAMLEAFVRMLIDNGLIQRREPADEYESLDQVTRVISCVAIAGRLGLDHGYENDDWDPAWPYWSSMKDDYRGAVARARAGLEEGAPPPPLPAGFAADRFMRLVSGKDTAWLRMAARMISGSAWRRHAEGLVEWISKRREECPEGYCRRVLREMTSPEIGITLEYSAKIKEGAWNRMVAEHASETMGVEAWSAEDLAAKSWLASRRKERD